MISVYFFVCLFFIVVVFVVVVFLGGGVAGFELILPPLKLEIFNIVTEKNEQLIIISN